MVQEGVEEKKETFYLNVIEEDEPEEQNMLTYLFEVMILKLSVIHHLKKYVLRKMIYLMRRLMKTRKR